tara:strand:+ start:6517 stop:8331 length:1815 start_codon:yes stop_codon:yes gene_type:complete
MNYINKIRRAQSIYTWGIGQTIDLADGSSLMLAGLDAWDSMLENADDRSEFKFRDIRLQKKLGVNHFILPPEYRSHSRGMRVKNPYLTLPFVRFPLWHYCPFCGNMKKSDLYTQDLTDSLDGMMCTSCNSTKPMTPSRFACICEKGHIEDFPYDLWAHWGGKKEINICSDPKIKMIEGSGPDLKDIRIICNTCNKKGNSLGGMHSDINKVKKCSGHRPWLGEIEENDCNQELTGTLRGASYVYNPIIKQSIYLANTEEIADVRVQSIVDEFWDLLTMTRDIDGNIGGDNITYISQRHNVDPTVLTRAINKQLQYEELVSSEVNENTTEEEYRRKEYNVILSKEESHELIMDTHDLSDYEHIQDYFDNITLIHRLRESIAFCGFTRIKQPGIDDTIPAIKQLRKNHFRIQENDRWLPGTWSRGEGIFLDFNYERLNNWKNQLSVINNTKDLLDRNQEYYHTFENIDQSFIMMHTFAHIMINQMAFDCGYGSSAIKERIYFSSNPKKQMSGLLLYTTGDSEGSLGGLVKLGKPELLITLIINSLENAKWCSSDPICIDSKGQGVDGCNLAACHNCALVSETSCENGNRLLDRNLLINEDSGYFCDF